MNREEGTSSRGPKKKCHCVLALSFLIIFIAAIVFQLLKHRSLYLKNSIWNYRGGEATDQEFLFKLYDTNRDGVLSYEEFQDLAVKFSDVAKIHDYEKTAGEDDKKVFVQSHFQPLLLDTMSKAKEGWSDQDKFNTDGLQSWTTPHVDQRLFGATDFKPFLPKDLSNIKNHEVYYVVEPPEPTHKGIVLSSDRYVPMKLSRPGDILIHRLLSMFHPKPFVYMRFAPQGSVACVRASNEDYLDIMFRIHAEFQLNEPPHPSFWFTPAQFTGHIILDRSSSNVANFHLYVPNKNKLNVDMEWQKGTDSDPAEGMEVDIGYMPLMELKLADRQEQNSSDNQQVFQNDFGDGDGDSIIWQDEISEEEVFRKLETQLYPFKQVNYYNFTSVFAEAQEVERPIHSIILWGALDDQSC